MAPHPQRGEKKKKIEVTSRAFNFRFSWQLLIISEILALTLLAQLYRKCGAAWRDQRCGKLPLSVLRSYPRANVRKGVGTFREIKVSCGSGAPAKCDLNTNNQVPFFCGGGGGVAHVLCCGGDSLK